MWFIWWPTISKYGTRPFYDRGCAQMKTHAQQEQKFLTPSAFPLWGASCTKQYTVLLAGKDRWGASPVQDGIIYKHKWLAGIQVGQPKGLLKTCLLVTFSGSNITSEWYWGLNLLWCWQKKDTGNTKRETEKHIYSSNRNKIQVNLVKQ